MIETYVNQKKLLPLEQAVEGISQDYGYDPQQVRGLLRMFGIRL